MWLSLHFVLPAFLKAAATPWLIFQARLLASIKGLQTWQAAGTSLVAISLLCHLSLQTLIPMLASQARYFP